MIRSEGRKLIGQVTEIYRYPVKSMQGESLVRATLGSHGLLGDRQFAVIDVESGRVASAKNPRRWARLLQLHAKLHAGVLSVTADGGSEFRADRDDFDAILSRLLARPVTLCGSPSPSAAIEVYWPDVAGLPNADSNSVEMLTADSYFDLAPIHLLATATLERFRELTPDCDFDARRFRPNIVIETLPELTGFVETDWLGRNVIIGEAGLKVSAPCSRCVMTTLAQPLLPANPQVLKAAVTHNAAIVGVYAKIIREGAITTGAPVWLE